MQLVQKLQSNVSHFSLLLIFQIISFFWHIYLKTFKLSWRDLTYIWDSLTKLSIFYAVVLHNLLVPVLLFKSLHHHWRYLMSGITVYNSETKLRATPTFLLLDILNNSGSSPAIIIPAKLFVGRKKLICLCQLLGFVFIFSGTVRSFLFAFPHLWTACTLYSIGDLVWHSQKVDCERWQQVDHKYLLRKS